MNREDRDIFDTVFIELLKKCCGQYDAATDSYLYDAKGVLILEEGLSIAIKQGWIKEDQVRR